MLVWLILLKEKHLLLGASCTACFVSTVNNDLKDKDEWNIIELELHVPKPNSSVSLFSRFPN